MSQLSETEIITRYFQPLEKIASPIPAQLAIGDDAAILDIPKNKQLVVSTDNLVKGVHFPENMAASDIGKRALAINLSDLAAMGATPAWFMLALTMPDVQEKWLADFSSGLSHVAQKFSCQLIGGNTCRGPFNIAISIYGLVDKGNSLLRCQAKVGDDIYVTGHLGDAYAGLQCLQQGITQYPALTAAFVNPQPKVESGLVLANLVASALDISDGLDTDLNRLLTASRVGAEINIESLPLSKQLIDYLGLDGARQAAINGGDDYELCFTLTKEKADELTNYFKQRGLLCSRIGEVTKSTSIVYKLADRPIHDVVQNGYKHFI